MNENTTEGSAKVVLGKFETAAGEALGDSRMQARGVVDQVGGHVQEAAGLAQEIAGRAKEAVSTIGGAYGRASSFARKIDPFVQEKPYAALTLAAAVGLLVGLLIAGGQPRVVYLKQSNWPRPPRDRRPA